PHPCIQLQSVSSEGEFECDALTALMQQLRGWRSAHLKAAPRRPCPFEFSVATTHYQGRVLAWDVVNEAGSDHGSRLRDTMFRQKLGDGYIADAFRIAHAADPQAFLFYSGRGRDDPSPGSSGRPPHRSQRAELPHWALASGASIKPLLRPGM